MSNKNHHNKGKFLTGCLLFSILGTFFFTPDAHAALQIKQVLRGEVSFAVTEDAKVVALGTSVDISKSIIILSVSAGTATSSDTNNAPGEVLFSAAFDDASNISVFRGLAHDNGSTATVAWQVIEFADGVTVYSGSTTLNDLSKVITLSTSLDATKSLLIVTGRTTNKFFNLGNQSARSLAYRNDETWEITGAISSYGSGQTPGALTFTRNDKVLDAGTPIAVSVYYQVVVFDSDVNVQYGTATIANTATSGYSTLGTTVDEAKSLLFFTTRPPASTTGAGLELDFRARGEITNTGTRATFTRVGTTGQLDIVWYVLTFTDATNVQKGTLSGTGAALTSSPNFSPALVTDRAFSITSASGGTAASTTTLDDTNYRNTISTTVLTATREGGATASSTVAYFTAQLPAVKLVAPNGGETLLVNDVYNITWRAAASVANVKLEYSDDNGTSWKTIIASTAASANSYAWTVGKDSTNADILPTLEKETDCLVRVSSAADSTLNDVSNAALTIKSKLAITAPNGSEAWNVGDNRNITWTKNGNFDSTVKLQYSIDAPHATWTNITGATALSAGAGTFAWNPVPLTASGTTVKVRVISNTNADVTDDSNANFSIQGNIAVTAPTTGTQWATGVAHTIAWTLNSSTSTVNIYYSLDNGGTYTLITTGGPVNAQNVDSTHGTYDWTPPLTDVSTLAKVKVVDSGDATTFGVSNAFEIIASVEVTRPTSGTEVFKVGTTEAVNWTVGPATGVTNVNVKYSVDGGAFNTVVGGGSLPAASGTFNWTVPDNISNNVKVRVEDSANPNLIYDESNVAFKIKGRFVFTAPTTNEVLRVAGSKAIQWDTFGDVLTANCSGVGCITIALSKTGGDPYPITVATNVDPSLETYSWTNIPNETTDTAKLKIFLPSDPTPPDGVAAESATFKIKGNISDVFPNGGQTYLLGNVIPITWTPAPGSLPGTARILYSTNGGSTFPGTNLVNDTTAVSAGAYNWTVPDIDVIYPTMRIKVELIGQESDVSAMSQNNFTIKGNLNLTRPNGGETFEIGTTENIEWTRLGTSLGLMNIFYSINGGSTFAGTVASNVDSGTSPYLWTIPTNIIGTNDKNIQMKIKIQSATDSSIQDESAAVFTIKARIISLNLNGGQTIFVDDPYNITWTTEGSVNLVDLKYSTNAGGAYGGAIATNASNVDSYNWTVANAIGSQLRLKVQSSAYPSDISVASAANFTIKGKVNITSPTGSNVGASALIAGNTHIVTWTKNGDIGDVNISFSDNGGSTWSAVATVPSADLNYTWSVPDKIDTDNKLKIEDADDSSVSSVSAAFEIKGKLDLTYPNGGETFNIGGANPDILWGYQGTVGNVSINYSTNGGTSYDGVVVASVAHNNLEGSGGPKYNWTLPNTPSTQYRIKIASIADPTYVKDNSEANFSVRGAVFLDTPNAANITWKVDEENLIEWHITGAITNIGLYYSTDGTTFPNTIIASTAASAGSYPWTMPTNKYVDYTSDTAKIKIVDVNDAANVYDISDNNFAMKPVVTLGAPDGGEVWIVGTDYNITWTTKGAVNNVKLQFSEDGGTGWPEISPYVIVASTPSAAQSYQWGVPDKITASAMVRVSKVGDSVVKDESFAYFNIKGSITVTSPNAGTESWSSGTLHPITWTKTGTIATVKILYSPDPGTVAYTQIPGATGIDASLGTWDWTIADDTVLSTTGKIKIVNESDSTVNDESNNGFEVKGGLVLLTPNNSGITMTYNGTNTYNITWDRSGAIQTLNIYYSQNNGANFTLITNAANAALETYPWTIPDIIVGNTMKIKIEDKDNTTVNDVSENAFKIVGGVHLDSPNGGQTLIVDATDSTADIKWTPTGTYTFVNLEYYNGALAQWVSIATNVAAGASTVQQTYADWQIPDLIRTDVKVRVSDAGNAGVVTDESDATFSIMGSLEVTAPNGGQIWYVSDTNRDISWNGHGTINPVKIEYSTNNGGSWTTITSSATGGATGAYTHTWSAVPDVKTEQALIKVSDPNYPGVNDVSNAVFSIRPQILVSQPLSGADLTVGPNSAPIRWSIPNGAQQSTQVPFVNLYYSVNGGAYTLIEANVDNSLRTTYTWNTIPDAISQNVVIKVADPDNLSTILGISPTFHIVGGVTLTAPNGGQDWEALSTTNNITWTKSGSITSVNLYYSTDGTNYTFIATEPAASLSKTWDMTVAPIVSGVSNTARVKITDASNESVVSDTSNADFHIIAKYTVITPGNGTVLTAGEDYAITWNKHSITGVANVKIEYSTNGGSNYTEIATVPNTGSYTWTVNGSTLTTDGKIRISDPNQPAAFGLSTGSFKIQGKLTVTAPNTGNEAWDAGSPYDITWSKVGNIATVNIKYSANAGTSYPTTIASAVDVSGVSPYTYNWTIPAGITLSTQALVKVEDGSDSTVYDESNANFTVRGGLALNTPDAAGIVLTHTGTSTYNITWTRFGQVENVELRYSTNNGSSYDFQITPSTPGVNQSFTWTIPDKILGNVLKVKVIDASNSAVSDVSTNPFEIIGGVAVNSPNGAETWIVDETRQIKWTPTGTYNFVKLEYSTNGGTNWTQIVAQTPAGATGVEQSYNWTVPDAIGTNLLVRVSDKDHLATVTDVSNAPFNIMGSLEVSAPNGGQTWYVGDTNRNISWSGHGNIDPVKIEYSANNGGSWATITSTAIGGVTGAYSHTWPSVPDVKTEQALIKVSDPDYSGVNDVSNAVFSIRPAITVTQPLSAADITVGANTPIRWSNTGTTVSFVKLEYSKDGGAYVLIQNNVDNSLGTSYTWANVPDAISQNVNVRVSDVDNANVLGISPTFHIVGGLTLGIPNGGQDWEALSTTNNITWTKSGSIANVSLYYSTNSGTNYTFIATTPASGLSYTWNPMPAGVSNTARIKITDASNENVVNDASESDFHIIAKYTVTAPANGAVLTAGEDYVITWNKHDITGVANVKIEYSTNGGSNYTEIATVGNTGSYTWAVNGSTLTTDGKIRISDPNQPAAFGLSTGSFKIQGKLTVTAPNAGTEAWDAGSAYNITWSKVGNIATVNIKYSPDTGTTYPTTVASAVDVSGVSPYSYNWTIPAGITLSTTARIKVEDGSDSTVYDESNANFTVRGGLALNTPDAAGIVLTHTGTSTYNITWTRFGQVENVELRYSIDNGLNYDFQITPSTPGINQSFTWTIPDKILGNVLKVKVIDASNSSVSDASTNPFKIIGQVVVGAPNGAETWTVDSIRQIKWTPTGTYNFVKLEYSVDGGTNWTQIVAQTPAGATGVEQSYDWTVPDQIGTNLLVRVSDKDNLTTVTDTSNSAFNIMGALALTGPNGGQVWYAGDTNRAITWNGNGTISNVKAEYSTNNGGSWVTITSTATGGGTGAYSYTWPAVPDVKTEQALVKVSDPTYPAIADQSDAIFSIRPNITVTQPLVGADIAVGANTPVRWSATGTTVNSVKLEYSVNGGSYVLIQNNVDNSLGTSYTWANVPDAISQNVNVRVTDVDNANVLGISPTFHIVGGVTLGIPNGNQNWEALSTTNNITWTKSGSIANVSLYYSTDSGVTYPNFIATVAASAGLHTWNPMPAGVSNTARIKITDASNESVVNDASESDFHIIAKYTVTAPGNGAVLTAGSPYVITWDRHNITGVANVKLEFSTNGGADYTTIGTVANTGSYSWTVDGSALSTDCKIRISDPNQAAALGISSGSFKIQGSITVTAPNAGTESWDAGSAYNITWTKTGAISTVKILYSSNSGTSYPTTITTALSAVAGTYSWTIPTDIALSVLARVKIVDEADSTVYDESNNDFTVKGALTLNTPNGTEDWVVGTAENVTWTRFGSIANVDLAYSTDSGTTYPNVIIGGISAVGGTYAWNIPDAISTTVRVKITDSSNPNVFDTSNANFSIKGKLLLNVPNGGQIWTVGTNENIMWTRTGSVANVKLEYSTDGGTTYPNLIVAVTGAAVGSYSWGIPDAIGSIIRVKVTDTTNASVTDVSDGNFSIKGALTLNSPNGGELWTVGNPFNIDWTRTGSIANVKLEYSTDSGVSYPNVIIASTDGSTGLYSWTIPNAIGSKVRVKVTDATNANVFDTSNNDFSIIGRIIVSSPNGGEAWIVNSQHPITWSIVGSLATVNISYATDGGTNFTNEITASTDAATGSFLWTLPDDISSTVKVKVTNNSDSSIFDVSDTNFKIRGDFAIVTPNGSEEWVVAGTQSITWTRTGSIANAKLEYSTNGGTSYPNLIIASTSAAALSYVWTIPDAIGSTLRVRISNADDATVYDDSNANFIIKGGFDITSPDGGEVWTVQDNPDITWTTNGTISNVKLEYSSNGGTSYDTVIAASTANTGTYPWTVPDVISTTVKMKVSDVNNANAFGVSANNFKIRGSLTVTSPNGSENWDVASPHNITWTKVGSISTVNLKYSSDSGSTFPNTIATAVAASAGTYAWTVPDTISVNVRVKITDESDSTVFDTSNSNFIIKGALTLNAPNGAEDWVVGTAENITWTRFGSIPFVNLLYSTNSGGTYPFTIVSSLDGALLTYAWAIPDAISALVRVKVVDSANANVFDTSDADFSIKGQVALTAPNGGEIWTVGSSQNVTWTRTGTVINIKLEYSTNGGTNYPNVIIAATSGAAGTYSWTIPDAIGSTLKVRISDASNATVNDVSDGNFSIQGALALLAPNGGEVWVVGDSEDIVWTRTGSIANVKLEYSTDSGVSYPSVIIASTPASAGTYAWTVPDAVSIQARVKVSDVTNANVFDTSNANFKIQGSFTLTSPDGGESWIVNSSHPITWTKTGTIANALLEYSIDSGATYPNVIVASTSATAGTYNWTIPDSIDTNVRVRISNVSDATVFDISNADFKIRGSLTLTSPNGTEQWKVNESRQITWTMVGTIANAKLVYSTNSGGVYDKLIIASTPAGALNYFWTIPDTVSTTARLEITDAADVEVVDRSDADFSIQGAFAVTSPNGGEVWTVASSHNITWTTTGSVQNVKIEYSTDSGTTYPNVIIASVGNTGSYAWTIPDAISTLVRVRVSDVNDATALDTSNNNMKIQGSLVLNAPNGTEVWKVGESRNVTWTRNGSIGNVKLEYSTDSGSTFPNLIVASIAAIDQTYAWTIPDNISSTVQVRVTNTADATIYDTSNADFAIKGSLTLGAPNGSEVWVVGEARTITWTSTGSMANVKLDYSTNAGLTYPNAIIAQTPNDGSHGWTIPDAISTTARVKVSDFNDANVSDESNANFKIQGSLTIVAPNGTEVWKVTENRNITWTKTGSIANVKLEFSTNGGTTFPNVIIASTPAADLSYTWAVPDTISDQVKVKITDLTDSAVTDASDANFKIAGSLTLSSPNGGEVWEVASVQPVTWARVGSITNVKLEYSTNGGVDYPNVIIASTSAAALSYSWTIPDTISTTLRVRVSDAADASVLDTSDANFKIRGAIVLTAPNGAEIWYINTPNAITWTRAGSVANIKIEYSINSGAAYPYTIVASTAASALSYNWTIPDNISPFARVKITDTSDSTVTDASDADLILRGSFIVTAPNGGEDWNVADVENITWTTSGTIPNVKLQYSTNAGSSWNMIIASTTNTGTYGWTIPDAITQQALVRVVDVNDPAALDASDANFKIHGKLTLTAPNGGEEWKVATAYSTTWTRVGSVANVKLEYSTDGGSTYPNLIIASTSAAPLSYLWTVPDAISNTVKVKVSDAQDSYVQDVSNSAFKIKGDFAVTSPNGGEIWKVTEIHNITWNTFGTVPNVKLEYSANAGSSYTVITNSVANAGTFPWTVPDAMTAQARVRIIDVTDSTALDVSDSNFTIRGDLTITAPNGGEKWSVGTSRTIAWNRLGSIPLVRIEYSNNNGAGFIPITSSTANSGSYAWTIPDDLTTQALVKITDTANAIVTDQSDAVFKIQGTFNVTSPNGGETWLAGESRNITWTSQGTIAFAKIEYSIDSGATYPATIATASNTGTYSWDIPGNNASIIKGTLRVKVSDSNDSEAFDTSNGDFRIRAILGLTYPNGSEKLTVGNTANITWAQVGAIPNAHLSYSRDGFLSDINVINAAAPNNGTYAWTIPDAISNSVRVRVMDPNDSGANDISNNDLRIVGGFTLTAPNGGEKWDVGSPYNITWNQTGTVTTAKIEYSTNGGASYPNVIIATPNDGSYTWTIPDTISATARVRISDNNDSTAFDESDADFKIRAKFAVTSPDGAEIWTVGDSHDITWTTIGTVANVRLDYSTDSGTSFPSAITASTANDGTHSWTIPDAISTTVRVRVMSTTDSDAFAFSPADFKIRGSFNLTAPNGGEAWNVNQNNNITWTNTGTIPTVQLLYSTNSGTSFPNTITASVGNTNTYDWLIPDTVSPSAQVRILDTRDASVYDDSDANFTIRGFFTLTSPNGGEVWTINDVQPITWTWGATIPFVKLSYSTDSGTTYPNVINASAPNGAGAGGNFSYNWTIPDNASPSVRVKVEDVGNSAVSDASDANFRIRASFTLTSPNGGERWVTNESKTLTWTTNGTIPNVKLSYSINGGTSYPYVIAASTSNTGSLPWTVPDHNELKDKLVLGSFVAGAPLASKVKVEDVNDVTAYDESNTTFNIDYYNFTWGIRDLLTNSSLSQLNGDMTSGWQFSNLAAPLVTRAPFGHWDMTWSKTGYGDVKFGFDSDADKTFNLFMETSVIHLWRSETRFSYQIDPDGAGPQTDKLELTSWLERDGGLVTGGVFYDVKIYDGTTLIQTLTPNTEAYRADLEASPYSNPQGPDASGTYHISWSGTPLVGGKVYTVVTRIQIGTGGTFNTPSAMDISDVKLFADLKAEVATKLDIPLSQVKTEVTTAIQEQLDDQNTIIQAKLDLQRADIQTTLSAFTNSVEDSIISLEEAAASSLDSAHILEESAVLSKDAATDLQKIAKRQSARLLLPQAVITGEPAKLRYRGYSAGLHPLIDILDGENNPIIQAWPMIELADKPGLYEYTIDEVDTDTFAPGVPFTVIVTDSETGSVESGSVFVEVAAGQLLMPRSVLVGDRVSIRFRGKGDWKPTLTMWNFEDKAIVEDQPMVRSKENPEVFEYIIAKVEADEFTPGKPVTVSISEKNTGAMESGTFVVESTSLSALEGLVASGAGGKSIAKDTLAAVTALQGNLATGGNISMALENIKEKMDDLPAEIAKEGITAPVVKSINDIREQFINFAGEEGYDFSELMQKSLEESPTIDDIRSKTDEVQGSTELMQKIMERKLGGSEEPVVQMIFF